MQEEPQCDDHRRSEGAVSQGNRRQGQGRRQDQRQIPRLPDTSTDITAFGGKPKNGHPVLLLHVYSPTLGVDAVQVLVGVLFKINSGKYGWKLDVTVPQLPFGTAATTFDVTVQHKPWVTKKHKTIHRGGRTIRKTIKTKHYFASAKCSHGKWFYKGTFHYTSNSGPSRSGSLLGDRRAALHGQVAIGRRTHAKWREGRPPGRPSLCPSRRPSGRWKGRAQRFGPMKVSRKATSALRET